MFKQVLGPLSDYLYYYSTEMTSDALIHFFSKRRRRKHYGQIGGKKQGEKDK